MTTITTIATRILSESGLITVTSDVAVTAQIVLDENNYTVTDITLINLEKLIDNSINWINEQTNTAISALSGDAGSKTVNMDRNEATIVKSLSALLIRAYKDRGSAGIGGLSASSAISDPQYSLHSKIINDGLARLKSMSLTNIEYLIDDAIYYINSHAGTSIAALSGKSPRWCCTSTGTQESRRPRCR